MASNVFDMKTPFIIAHSLLWLVSSSHNVLPNMIASSNIQLAIRKDEEFTIPYSITASSLNHRQSSKATAMWISCLYSSFSIIILCFYSRVERKPRNLLCFKRKVPIFSWKNRQCRETSQVKLPKQSRQHISAYSISSLVFWQQGPCC